MKNAVLWIIGLALVAVGAVWLNSHDITGRSYAPEDAQDRELAQSTVDEPPPAAVTPVAKTDASLTGELPTRPVPYDQLPKEAKTEAPPQGPPVNKSDEKAVFY